MAQAIEEKKTYLLHWMYDFIEDDDEPAYLKSDVDEFEQIISAFIKKIAQSSEHSDYSWVVSEVEGLVKELNQLNTKHQHQLIEAHQREDICSLINLVIQQAGHECKDDITEQWREW